MKRAKLTRKKAIIVSSSVLLIFIVLGIGYYKKSETSEEKKKTYEVSKVQELVDASQNSELVLSSKVIAKNSQKIKIDPTKGKIKEISVKEGDTVKAGQQLFKYDSEQQMKAKEAGYTTLEKQRMLEASKTESSLKWDSYNKKLKAYEAAKLKVSQASDDTAKKEAEQEVKTLGDEVDQKYSEALTADAAVSTASAELEKSSEMEKLEDEKLAYDSVSSEGDGKVVSVNTELPKLSSEKQQSETFMEIIDQSDIYATGEVNEFDKDSVKLNQSVELVDRKDSTKRWKGKVTQIANLSKDGEGNKEESANTSKYPYKIKIEKGQNMPSLGTHLYARFLSNSDSIGKILIPKEYLFDISGNKASVWKEVNGKAKKDTVEFKAATGNQVEIVKGLSLTDSLIKANLDISQGTKVN